ncbi:TniB family NTP-binding protein [Rhodanobacter sp. MP7CTX1]|uniref:AAA family ATPase n=1 Tax=Rhodanobacter sp. MP7CTX1 TaxID=2723084 RepID=UPI001611A67B|nr:TniB family NTP-binding protein [Rhodanobacter sp. MP7CTX1]MBB6187562.1 hypothetical protein [Rhodanobacter sp. MP7CTX1]
MSALNLVHPELINGPNPLLEAAAPFLTFAKLPAALKHEPLKAIDWRSLPPEYRTTLLSQADQHYCPSRLILDFADSVQSMLRGGLMARNPLSVAEQCRINALALADNMEKVHLQSLRKRAGGGILSAITGMGKSVGSERILEAIAPQQVVVHSKSEVCGWSSLTQVLYLVIDAPFNGTPGGLLARIVEGLDALLGTDYSETLRKLRNLDAALLLVHKTLSNHRVGMLVIDENQQDNFDQSVWQRSFILFFLSVMNLGIPVMLLGNPQAFVRLETVSQNVRRFSTVGYYELIPAASSGEDWWSKDYVPKMCQFMLCDEAPPMTEIIEATFGMSAGVPGLFGPIWVEAQRIALRRGGDRTCVTHADLLAAGTTSRGKGLLAIASQISGATSLQRFIDIPAKVAVCRSESGEPNAAGPKASAEGERGVSEQMDPIRAKLERDMKAKEKAAAKRMEKANHLNPDDLRAYELKMEIYAGFEGAQEPLLTSGGRAPPKLR